jgi:hypothetical protein
VYDGCCWLETFAPASRGLDDAAAAVLPASNATFGLAPVDCVELVLARLPGARLESVWLIEISWSSWLSDTICPTISVGSTGDVGSWFCSSVTSRFKNVSCRLAADVAVELLDELLLEVLDVVGALAELESSGAAIFGVNP